FLPRPCVPLVLTHSNAVVSRRPSSSPVRPYRVPALSRHTCSLCPDFSTRADKHSHHPNLVGITSPNRTVFVPLFTFLILACLDDLHPQNLKSRISNLK